MDFSMFETIENTVNTARSKIDQDIFMKPNSMGRFPKNTPIGMAYVPMQQWDETYSIEKGFDRGTIFPELDLPFAPEEGRI